MFAYLLCKEFEVEWIIKDFESIDSNQGYCLHDKYGNNPIYIPVVKGTRKS